MSIKEKFDLYQDGILAKLKADEKFFRNCMTDNLMAVAAEYSCDIHVSANRLGDTFAYWKSDLDRVLDHDLDDRTVELDHFKHASFLCFWLRRHIPVSMTFFVPRPTDISEASVKQKYFAMYGNETCAIRVGMELCHAYELRRLRSVMAKNSTEQKLAQFKNLWERLTSANLLDPEFEIDFAATLKHKNNSPHSINLIFRSIFMQYRRLGRPH